MRACVRAHVHICTVTLDTFIYIKHGEHMGNTWGIHGVHMGNTWGTYGGNTWGTHGEYMGDRWGTYGGHMGEAIPPLDGGLSTTRG